MTLQTEAWTQTSYDALIAQRPPVLLIGGATASGKSALALALANEWGAEIVNADSMQVYADLAVLTARPAPAELAAAPHRLFGFVDAAEAFSTGRWLEEALAAIDDVRSRGRSAIVVGGTGLYFRSLTRGLAEIPPIPHPLREQIRAALAVREEAQLREQLRGLDPASEARIAPGDRQRLTRALEVSLATGSGLSVWQASTAPAVDVSGWRAVVVDPPRAELYRRCDARLERMLANGALEEVAALTARRLDPALPVMKALGVAAFAAHLRGETGHDEALAQARLQTRHYAKRQLTWFRNQTPDWPRLKDAAGCLRP
ncbi:MAG TPA: tRNA (adenosine(37)-N6)-dimethylallyltransferase MiaA [Caulobacteraceae bacterium]|jgi:tRNA dimethylallyltransferase|nr:tRNA (adenosine(37)-N6)-dimethylallyltransferase MiaA [Caulobacteraceae bacterium]